MADDREARIVAELTKLVSEQLDIDVDAAAIDADAPFFEGGMGIDSIAIVDLIAATEQHFALQFTDEDLVASSFESIRTLARLIATKPGVKLVD